MNPAGRRIGGRVVVLGFLTLVFGIAGTAIAFWLFGRDPVGDIQAMTPLDAQRVLLLRKGHRQHDFIHLTLRDVEAGQRWSVPFRAVPEGATPVVAGGNVATWIRNASGRLELHAFDLEHGDFVFRALATFVPPATDVNVSIVSDGTHVIAAASVAETRVYVVDGATGRVMSTHELDASPHAPELRVVSAGVVVTPHGGAPALLDATAGTLVPLPAGTPVAVAPRATIDHGIARYLSGTTRLSVRVDSSDAIAVGGAAVVDSSLWVYAEGSVASVDVAHARVRASHGPLSFVVSR